MAKMDKFKQAVDLARGETPLVPASAPSVTAQSGRPDHPLSRSAKIKAFPLKPASLEAKRIVAHNRDDARARSFDMLRTQVLQSMDNSGWQSLAITSPTAGCGKTVTAC